MPQYIQLWLPRALTLLQWVCGLGIAYAIANTTLALIGDGTSPVKPSESPDAFAVNSRSLPPAPTVAELTKRDLFGNPGRADATRSSAPAVPTRLPLTLKAVFVSNRPEQSSALISQRGKPGKMYGPGDTLPGDARLSEVEATQVILQRAGAREALAFKSKFQATSHRASQPGRQSNTTPNQKTPEDSKKPLLQQLTTELAQDPGTALERLGVSQTKGGGYRVSSTASAPYLIQSGLQAGDVVLSINGRPLGDISVDRMALANLATSDSVRVELLRNGQTLTITTRVPESLRQ